MTATDQRDTIAFLESPEAYGAKGTVERVDTHISALFLVGDRVYKLKRAVAFSYLDCSTVSARLGFCISEVRINRRTAPGLYLGIVPVRRQKDGRFVLGRLIADPERDSATDGIDAVDWLVVMARFDQSGLFDRLARDDRLTPTLLMALADEIAALHESAAANHHYGGADGLRTTFGGIAEELRNYVSKPFDADEVEAFCAKFESRLDAVAGLLDARRQAGRVRHCHGDLHLRNIVLIDGAPVLFDAIEFSDRIAHIDVLYDLAFLLMDLEHRGHRAEAGLVLNHYLPRLPDYDGLAAMPVFLACRAAIRAHTTATDAAGRRDKEEAAARRREAQSYLDLARRFLAPAAPRLIAVAGLSGSGKSTLARALAPGFDPAPGAVILRSDVIRKRLMGVAPTDRLGPEAYDPIVTELVYDTIQKRAETALRGGYTVIADAVYGDPAERQALEAVAAGQGVPFDGLWLDVPAEIMEKRLAGRSGDASDADAAVLRRQLERDPGPIGWHRLDAGGEAAATLQRARAILGA